MKKTLCATIAVAVLLVLNSVSQAQEETSKIPSEDAPITEKAQGNLADNQASVSDQANVGGAVELVEPVEPVEEAAQADSQAAIGTSDCVGCGQRLPIIATPAFSNCGSCGQTCSGCDTISATAYLQPSNSCCCNQIGQVVYDQPIIQNQVSSTPSNWVASPVSVVSGASSIVNPASAAVPGTVYAPTVYASSTQCGCSPCGSGYGPPTTVGFGFLTGNCTDCVQTRGRARGRLFRNR